MQSRRNKLVFLLVSIIVVLVGASLAWGISTGRISFKASTDQPGLVVPPQQTDAQLLASSEQKIDGLSASLLTDLGNYSALGDQERAASASTMTETAIAREKLLENLVTADSSSPSADGINKSSQLAIKLAFPEDIQQQFNEIPAVKAHIESTTRSLSGALSVLIADYRDNRGSRTDYDLRSSDGTTHSLRFVMFDPTLMSGDQITIKEGLSIGQNGVVAIRGDNADDLQNYLTVTKKSNSPVSYEEVPDLPGVQVAPAGTKTLAVLLFNFSNMNVQPVTKAKVQSTYFDVSKSVAAYYREVSGTQLAIQGDVVGWYTLNMNAPATCPSSNIQLNGLADAALAKARAEAGRTPFNYDYYAFVFPDIACNYVGLSQGANYTFIPVRSGDQNNSDFFRIPAHELGHNFGLNHASGYYCPDAQRQFDYYPYNERGQCVIMEYYDADDIMGYSTYSLNAIYKAQLGWLSTSRVQTITQNGSYTLKPINRSVAGIQVLKLPNTINGPTYIEYRRPSGMFDAYRPDASSVNGVLIRRLVNGRSLVLNASSPSNLYQAALALNKTFSLISSGVAITTKSLSDSSATVEIVYADLTTCVARSFTQISTPTTATVSRRFDPTKDYRVSITNNNLGTCQNSVLTPTVTFAAADINYLAKTIIPASLTLAIGQTGTTIVSIRAQANTPIGRHDVKINIVDPRNSSVTITTTVSYWVTY